VISAQVTVTHNNHFILANFKQKKTGWPVLAKKI